MKFSEVIINNYKSMGNEKTKLIFDTNITTIIGKNESGKSNLLEALSYITLNNNINTNLFLEKNRKIEKNVSIKSKLYFDESEINKYNLSEKSNFIIQENDNSPKVSFTGGFSTLLSSDRNLSKNISNLIDSINNNSLWLNDSNNKKRRIMLIKHFEEYDAKIFNFRGSIAQLEKLLNKNEIDYKKMKDSLKNISIKLDEYYSLLPQIYYRKSDKELKNKYKYDEIMDIITNNKDDIFLSFIRSANITKGEIEKLFNGKQGEQMTAYEEINNKISKNIVDKFNNYYDQDKIEIKVRESKNFLLINIKTDDQYLSVSERSNGLKWYVNLFIDIHGHIKNPTPTLYLLDEPGVHLHVNAQKKLLDLFLDLTKNNNQVIYTTHSPFMINHNNISNIRAIEKDNYGFTRIYKSGYDQNLSKISKMETISPLVEALGTKLSYNMGPSSTKLNLVTEGISDYFYMKAMAKFFNIENSLHVIPVCGAPNIKNVVSILVGWGCDFKVLLDHDKEGFQEYKKLKKNIGEFIDMQVFYVNGKSKTTQGEINTNSCVIEDLIDNSDLEIACESKTIMAKIFHDKLINERKDLSDNTKENFKKLFSILDVL